MPAPRIIWLRFVTSLGALMTFFVLPNGGAASQQPWTAMETEVRGVVFRIPRAYLHNRYPDGSFDMGLRLTDFSPLRLLGTRDDIFWREGVRVRLDAFGYFNGAESVRNALRFRQDISRVQILRSALNLDGPDGPPPPEGLLYFPGRQGPDDLRPLLRDVFLPTTAVRLAPTTGEELPEFIECNVSSSFNTPPSEEPFVPMPCEWHWVFQGLMFRTTLDRRHLVRWREIRDGIEARLISMVRNGAVWASDPERRQLPSRPPVLITEDEA